MHLVKAQLDDITDEAWPELRRKWKEVRPEGLDEEAQQRSYCAGRAMARRGGTVTVSERESAEYWSKGRWKDSGKTGCSVQSLEAHRFWT